MNKKYDYYLNLLGLRCPEPLMLIRKKIRSIKKGETIFFISDDFTLEQDIFNFCTFMQHKILFKHKEKKIIKYIIQK